MICQVKITNNTKITITNTRTGEQTTLLNTDFAEERVTGNVVAGIPFIDTIDDSLDSFVIQLKDYQKRTLFKPFDFVVFTVNDGIETKEKKYFVLFDSVQSYSQPRKTYVHNVSLIEPTKILEKTKIFNLNLTNQNDTFERQFIKAISNAEPVFYNLDKELSGVGTPIYNKELRFKISTNFYLFLQSKASKDFYFSNTDLRSVLDEMLGAYNARVTVDNVEYNNHGHISKILLGYRDITKISKLAPIWDIEEQGQIVFERGENDGQDYAGTIVARGNNSIVEEAITLIDTFKSENAVLNTNNAAIILPFPISDKGIKSLKLKNLKLTYRNNETYRQEVLSIDVDIAEYLIPSEQYELLDATSERAYLPYTIGDRKILFGKTWSKWWGEKIPNILNILIDAIPRELTIDGNTYELVGATQEVLDIADNFYKYCVECSYYPIINTVASVTKPNVYDQDEVLMGIVDSQTEQTLDIDRHGKKLAGLIKRTGNAEFYLDVKANYYSKLLPLMSKIDLPNSDEESEEEKGYVLYKREYSIYDNHIDCRYYFSKDFNAVQQNAGVNREKHLYDIPLESSETPIVIKKYLVFSKQPALRGGFNELLYVSALNTLLGKNEISYSEGTTQKTIQGKLRYLLFQSQGKNGTYPQNTENSKEEKPYADSKYRFVRPICSYALNKTMTFTANCLDNYSVDYSRDGYKFSVWGDAGNKISYNRYVDKASATIGENEAFELDFAFDMKKQDEENIKNLPVADKNNYVTCGLSEAPLMVDYYKDRTQTPLFVFALECIPSKEDYGNIIIGTEFAKKNNLVRANGEGLSGLKLYTSNTYTFNGDENMLPAEYMTNPKNVRDYFDDVSGYTVGLSNGAILPIKASNAFEVASWAIADEQGNIYLAVNGALRNIYVSSSNFPY